MLPPWYLPALVVLVALACSVAAYAMGWILGRRALVAFTGRRLAIAMQSVTALGAWLRRHELAHARGEFQTGEAWMLVDGLARDLESIPLADGRQPQPSRIVSNGRSAPEGSAVGQRPPASLAVPGRNGAAPFPGTAAASQPWT